MATDLMPPLDPAALPVWSRRLRELRLAGGLSQQELADRAGLALGTISAIERGGHSSTDSLQAIANALGYPLFLLFLEDGEGRLTPAQVATLIEKVVRCLSETLDEVQRRRP